MAEESRYCKLDCWEWQSLGMVLDADYSVSEERARELLAQMAETGTMDSPFMELGAAYGNQIRRI